MVIHSFDKCVLTKKLVLSHTFYWVLFSLAGKTYLFHTGNGVIIWTPRKRSAGILKKWHIKTAFYEFWYAIFGKIVLLIFIFLFYLLVIKIPILIIVTNISGLHNRIYNKTIVKLTKYYI